MPSPENMQQATSATPPDIPLTLLAAHRLEKLQETALTPEVKLKAILCLLDYLGALVSGLSAPWSGALLKYAEAQNSLDGECMIIGTDSKSSAASAAFVNASIAHSIIRDDMHLQAGAHIGVLVIPAALALAQRDCWTWEQLLKAIVAGYDMATALGQSILSTGTYNKHFRLSGIVGPFGAVAAAIAGSAELNIDQAASALSFAANSAAGLNQWAWAGGLEINTEMGAASRNGIASYNLAKAGLSSSDTILEGKDGLFRAYGCGDSASERFSSWVQDSNIGTGIMGARFKPVAGCNFVQTPSSVALNLSKQVVDKISQISRILIVTTSPAKAYPGCDSLGPFEKVQQTKMSIQLGVVTALVFGTVTEHSYCQFDHPDLSILLGKCTLKSDSEFDKDFAQGKQPSRIEVTMLDGATYKEFLPDVPWLEADAVRGRFEQEAAQLYDAVTVSRIESFCNWPNEGESCKTLFELLASAE